MLLCCSFSICELHSHNRNTNKSGLFPRNMMQFSRNTHAELTTRNSATLTNVDKRFCPSSFLFSSDSLSYEALNRSTRSHNEKSHNEISLSKLHLNNIRESIRIP